MPVGRKRGTRFSDIAARAGVGIATVDRVLNERGNVSAKTAARVIEAAQNLGVNRSLPTPWRRHRRYRVILPRQRASVADRLNDAFQRVAAPWRGSVTLERNFVDKDDPASLSDEIDKCTGVIDGIIVMPIDDPAVRDAVRRVSRHIPVVTLISDISGSGRRWFVGVDNVQAGRTAGFLCGRIVASGERVAVLWRGAGFSGQAARVRGFCDVLAERFPDLQVERHDIPSHDPDILFDHATLLMTRTPRLRAIYNAGLNEEPIAKAVVPPGSGARADLCYIAHELTPGNAERLRTGTLDFVIDQDTEQLAQRSFELLLAHDHIGNHGPIDQTTRFTIYCSENLPV